MYSRNSSAKVLFPKNKVKEFLATRIDLDEEAGDEIEEKDDKWVKEEDKEDNKEEKEEDNEEEKEEEDWVKKEENDFLLPDTFLSPPLGDIVVCVILLLFCHDQENHFQFYAFSFENDRNLER